MASRACSTTWDGAAPAHEAVDFAPVGDEQAITGAGGRGGAPADDGGQREGLALLDQRGREP
jgi:hypothetical protein